MRKIAWIIAAALGLSLAGCGGGGGSDSNTSSNSSSNSNSPTASVPAAVSAPVVASNPAPGVLAVDATAVPTASGLGNTLPITVGATAINNQPMVSVKVCTPASGGTLNCATIPNVIVDTGSVGLRLISSAIPSATSTTFAPVNDGTGHTLAECALFGSGYAWGTVQTADVVLSSEVAQSVPIHVISDPALTTTVPTDCSDAGGRALVTTTDLHANGILGIGVGQKDCGSACATSHQKGFYYTNAGGYVYVGLQYQVANPVSMFTGLDNNGVIVEMAQVSDIGAASTSGTLVFGIDTQANNVLANTGAPLIQTDAYSNFTSTYGAFTYTKTFFDSGSTVMFFPDLTIPTQFLSSTQYYTPTATVGRSTTLAGINSSSITLGFNIANASILAATGNHAFNNLGVYQAAPNQFDFGLPFFYGRHVYFGISGTTSPGGGTGPYVAYVSK